MRYCLVLFSLLLVNCSTSRTLVDENMELIDISEKILKNSNLLKNIDEYLSVNPQYKNKYIPAVFASELKDIVNNKKYFVGTRVNLSQIFRTPPSYYFMYNERPVLIYCRDEGYMNPNLYSTDQLIVFEKYLLDNWNLYYLSEYDTYQIGKDDIRFRSPNYLKVNGTEVKQVNYMEFRPDIFLFPNEEYEFREQLKIDSLRVKKGNIDDYN